MSDQITTAAEYKRIGRHAAKDAIWEFMAALFPPAVFFRLLGKTGKKLYKAWRQKSQIPANTDSHEAPPADINQFLATLESKANTDFEILGQEVSQAGELAEKNQASIEDIKATVKRNTDFTTTTMAELDEGLSNLTEKYKSVTGAQGGGVQASLGANNSAGTSTKKRRTKKRRTKKRSTKKRRTKKRRTKKITKKRRTKKRSTKKITKKITKKRRTKRR